MNHPNDETNEWARAALRSMLDRCLRALQAELALEMRLVRMARARLKR